MLLQASGITSKSICPWYVVQVFNNNQEIIWSNIFGMFGQILNIPPNSGQIENFYDTYKFNQGDLFCRNIFSWQNNVARLSRSRQKKFIKISHFLFQKSLNPTNLFFKFLVLIPTPKTLKSITSMVLSLKKKKIIKWSPLPLSQ